MQYFLELWTPGEGWRELSEFQQAVRDAGVYELLDRVNLCGTAGHPTEVLGEMIGA